MSIESTKKVLDKYLAAKHGDVSMLAPNVTFTNMATGEVTKTPEGVSGMLNFLYPVAFEATAEPRNTIISDGHAVFEVMFVGEHIGEFAGMPPTHKKVRVPQCVIYDIADDQIQAARVYFELPALMAQLGVSP